MRLADYEAIGSRAEHRPLTESFAALGAEVSELNDRFDDDQLAAIVEWLRESNAAVERSIERMRHAARGGG